VSFDAVIFDRDGTLFDSLGVILRAFAHGAEPFLTEQPSREEWIAAFGPDEPEVLAKFISAEHKQAAFNRFFRYYRDHFAEVQLYTGVRELLLRLKARGLKLMIFTGGGRVSTHFCLEQAGILELFDALICGEDVQHPKPNPEGLLKLVQEQRLNPVTTAVVGDSGSDIEAGSAAGMKTIWLNWSENAQSTPPRIEPDFVCNSVAELKRILLQEDPS